MRSHIFEPSLTIFKLFYESSTNSNVCRFFAMILESPSETRQPGMMKKEDRTFLPIAAPTYSQMGAFVIGQHCFIFLMWR